MRKVKTIILFVTLMSILTANTQDLTVLTYNIKFDDTKDSINSWNSRKDFLISQLRFYEPTVFGTQEGLIHQLSDVEEGLNGYAFVGVGRDKGDEKGEHTALFYDTTKVAVLENSTFWLSKSPDKPSIGWDAAIKRICTYALFELKDTHRKFFVFNTHFDHVGDKARTESAKLVLNKIEEINAAKLPVVLMGDFNLEQESDGIQLISKFLSDTHGSAKGYAHGPKGTFNGFHFSKPVERRIDYIFVSDNVWVKKSAILSDSFECRYPSDHLPVLAQISLLRNN